MRLVLDSSVLIAVMKPAEAHHADAADFLERVRVARGSVALFSPPELWLEVRVAALKMEKAKNAPRPPSVSELLRGLPVELVPMTSVDEIDQFFEELGRRTRGKAPFANATDLVYLWAAWQTGATLVTLDGGLLKYHGMVCDVTRPQDAYFRAG
ncbi:PIN domain-containing protein [Polyangium aurulentum]|nr:PIN domain-containing protein [Polyangium aurulentum]